MPLGGPFELRQHRPSEGVKVAELGQILFQCGRLTENELAVRSETVHHWRSSAGFEVDFVLGDHTAIEIKAKETVSDRDLRSLRALAEEKKLKRYLCVSLESRPRRIDGVAVWPWRQFLDALWNGELSR